MPEQYKVLTIPFARDTTAITATPVIPDDQNPAEPNAASWKLGFPHITMIPLETGGVPPYGQDFNAIFRDISEHIVHQNMGGLYKFEPEVVSVGGYPAGAVLAANDGLSLWVSLVEDNTQDFNGEERDQWAMIAFDGLEEMLDTVQRVDQTVDQIE